MFGLYSTLRYKDGPGSRADGVATLNQGYRNSLQLQSHMIGFFVPCYIDALAPQAAKASYNILRRLGVEVEVVEKAVCCGMPLGDMGYASKVCHIESQSAELLEKYSHIVVPSGICTDQFRNEFKAIPQTREVTELKRHTYDIVEYLHDILQITELPWHPRFPHRVALHVGCHALRYLHEASPSELMEKEFSKLADLLNLVEGIEVCYAKRRDECCGFGGTFAIWDSPCSGLMGLDKVTDFMEEGLEYVVSGDCSCLLHQEGIARKNNIPLKAYHIAEILNGEAN